MANRYSRVIQYSAHMEKTPPSLRRKDLWNAKFFKDDRNILGGQLTFEIKWTNNETRGNNRRHKVNQHHHFPEGLGVFPVPWSSRWSWSLHLFLGRVMFLRPFGLYCSACFGSLFVSILYTCCSHFSWYCFISFTVFSAPVFCLIHWFFSLSSFVIPSNCLKNFICAASKRCSSLFFSTQASLPNFKHKVNEGLKKNLQTARAKIKILPNIVSLCNLQSIYV